MGVAEYVRALLAFGQAGAAGASASPLRARAGGRLCGKPPALARGHPAHAGGERGLSGLYSHQALATDDIRAGHSVWWWPRPRPAARASSSRPAGAPGAPSARQRGPRPRSFPAEGPGPGPAGRAGSRPWSPAGPRRPGRRPPFTTATPATISGARIRRDPPTVLISNPEMLHLALLPHHEEWAPFLARAVPHRGGRGPHLPRRVRGAHGGRVPPPQPAGRPLRRDAVRLFSARPRWAIPASWPRRSPASTCRPAVSRPWRWTSPARRRAHGITSSSIPAREPGHGGHRPAAGRAGAQAAHHRLLPFPPHDRAGERCGPGAFPGRGRAASPPIVRDSCPRRRRQIEARMASGRAAGRGQHQRPGRPGHRHRRAGCLHFGGLSGHHHVHPCSGAGAWAGRSRSRPWCWWRARTRWTSIS